MDSSDSTLDERIKQLHADIAVITTQANSTSDAERKAAAQAKLVALNEELKELQAKKQ